jgi:tetratricopeptide (TPR) repeat protein
MASNPVFLSYTAPDPERAELILDRLSALGFVSGSTRPACGTDSPVRTSVGRQGVDAKASKQAIFHIVMSYPPVFRPLILALALCWLVAPNFAVQGHHLTPGAQEEFAAGTNALKRGDSAVAIKAFMKVLESDHSFAPAYLNLGLVYHSGKKYDKAIESFSKALELDNNLGGAALFLGIDYCQTSQNSNAIKMLQKALRLMPDRTKDIYPWLGKSFLSSGQLKLAIPYLEQASESSPNDLTLRYDLARAHMMRSMELFEGIKSSDPQSYLVHLILAETYLEQENFELAVGEYKNVLKVNPTLPGVHEGLGNTYWRMRNYHEAEVEFRSELKIDPYNVPAIYKLGRILTETGRLDEAIPYLQEATRRSPSFADAYFEIGKVWFRKEQFKQAVANLERGTSLDPENASAYLFLGQAYAKLGQPEKSRWAFQRNEILNKKQDEAVKDNYNGFVRTYGKGKPKD